MSLAQAGDDMWDKLAQEAAFLHAVCRLHQGEIGKKLGCSQSHVSRLLERAKAKGWLKTEVHFVETGIPPERKEELHHRFLKSVELTKALRKLKSPTNTHVSVFEGGSDSTDPSEYKLRLKKFSQAATSRVKELLRHARIVGVAWGQTLWSVVEELVSSGVHLPQGLELQFVPVCPQVVRVGYPEEYSSSGLVERLNRIVGNGEEERLSLSGVPAYIPRHYKSQEIKALKKYINNESDSYRKIFGNKDALVDEIDTLLTSLGNFTPSLESIYVKRRIDELVKAWGIKAEDLQRLFYGDMAGVLIPRTNLSPRDESLVAELDEMQIGLKERHLRRIAQIGSVGNRPGNIVIAVGRQKAPVLFEVIRRGLVNEVIIDRSLAAALEQELEHYVAETET